MHISGVEQVSIAQRTHEIDVRMGLEAALRDVVKLTVRERTTLAAVGIGIVSFRQACVNQRQ